MRKEYLEAPKVAWACLTRPMDALAGMKTWEVPTLAANDSLPRMVDLMLVMEVGQGYYTGPAENTFTPASSNREVAKIASDLRLRFAIPIYAQDEAARCLRRMDDPADQEFVRQGDYADSYEVVSVLADHCRTLNFERILVVTHPLHQWRVMRLVAHFGLVPYAADCSTVPFDKNSEQPWCRSAEAFRSYELKARILYLGRGWI